MATPRSPNRRGNGATSPTLLLGGLRASLAHDFLLDDLDVGKERKKREKEGREKEGREKEGREKEGREKEGKESEGGEKGEREREEGKERGKEVGW